ncbi:MAG: hypothetical protein MHM6MM_004992 [Cercozoa sp. M6MM]
MSFRRVATVGAASIRRVGMRRYAGGSKLPRGYGAGNTMRRRAWRFSSGNNAGAANKAKKAVSPSDAPSSADKVRGSKAPTLSLFSRLLRRVRAMLRSFFALLRDPVRLRKKTSESWKHIVAEMKHYWAGAKLLSTDVATASKIVNRKLLRGKAMTRRERRQLQRTVADILRLVPFAPFIIIPFGEVFLPVAIKVFPEMLPTTMQTEAHKDARVRAQLNARLEMASFLQETVSSMATDLRTAVSVEEVSEIMAKVRHREDVTNDMILRIAPLFSDDATLDSMGRRELEAMCRYMGVRPIGPDVLLVRLLNAKMESLRQDDLQIIKEGGIESMSGDEIRQACRDRGMRSFGLNTWAVRRNLRRWLELSVVHKVPPSLLVLSGALRINEAVPDEDPTAAVGAAIQRLEESAIDEVLVESVGVDDREKEAAVIRANNERIEQETRVAEQAGYDGDIDRQAEERAQQDEARRAREAREACRLALEEELRLQEEEIANATEEPIDDIEVRLQAIKAKALELDDEMEQRTERLMFLEDLEQRAYELRQELDVAVAEDEDKHAERVIAALRFVRDRLGDAANTMTDESLRELADELVRELEEQDLSSLDETRVELLQAAKLSDHVDHMIATIEAEKQALDLEEIQQQQEELQHKHEEVKEALKPE